MAAFASFFGQEHKSKNRKEAQTGESINMKLKISRLESAKLRAFSRLEPCVCNLRISCELDQQRGVIA
jgi:hypothetical protein